VNKIAVFDCDDVLAQLRTLTLKTFSEALGRPLHMDELTHFNLNITFGEEYGGPVDDLFHNMNLSILAAEKYASTFLWDLKNAGWDLHVVTARFVHEKQITVDWLKAHDIPIDEVHAVGFNTSKADTIRTLGDVEFYVDDNDEHVAAAEQLPNVKRTYLMTRPWNTKAKCGLRVSDLSQIAFRELYPYL
jgi:uncharacterized HAD superfamily protein